MGERIMPGGRDWDPDMPDAAVTLNYDDDVDLTLETRIRATRGDSIATAINTGDFARVDRLNSAKSARHDPVTRRRADRNKTSEWQRLNDVKCLVRPGTTWYHPQAHRAKEAIQTQVGRVRNEFFQQFPTHPN